MSERHGDGDLDVDAAWAQIVAHWHEDEIRIVTDDDSGVPPRPATAEGVTRDGEQDVLAPPEDAGVDDPRADEAMRWTELGPDGWSGVPAAPPPPAQPPAQRPPARGEIRPVGRRRRYDEVDDDTDTGPGLGWDDIRSHVGGEGVRASSRDDTVRPDDPLAALDDHFEPPEPPSLRLTDPVSALAWLGALGGPLFLLVAALAWRTAPSVLIGAAVLAFVAGFVTLVVRMPDEREDEDDGAVV